jgi:hypothetical protein
VMWPNVIFAGGRSSEIRGGYSTQNPAFPFAPCGLRLLFGDETKPPHRMETDAPDEDGSECDDECNCYIKAVFIPVGDGSSSNTLVLLANLFIDNQNGKDMYHTALKIQVDEDDDCPTYIVELTDFVDGVEDQKAHGQVKAGYAGPSWMHALTGQVYGIRKWRDGEIVDGDKAMPNSPIISEDCEVCAALLNLVSSVPSNDYGSEDFGEPWTSNSVAAYLLQKAGLDPARISPPPNGMVPGWNAGIEAAKR